MTIPSQVEQDIISGKAVYRTMQFGTGGQNILPVGQNQSVTIFGYVFNPAGGGITYTHDLGVIAVGNTRQHYADQIRPFMCQEILIWTGNDFYPFVENVAVKNDFFWGNTNPSFMASTIMADAKVRSTYIRANQNVSFAVLLAKNEVVAFRGTIPVTESTPRVLSWGGTADQLAVQTDLGGFPDQFLQPKVQGWDLPPYSYGLIPANAQEQYFHAPAQPGPAGANGPFDPSELVNGIYTGYTPSGANYKLQIHYALYNNPEK